MVDAQGTQWTRAITSRSHGKLQMALHGGSAAQGIMNQMETTAPIASWTCGTTPKMRIAWFQSGPRVSAIRIKFECFFGRFQTQSAEAIQLCRFGSILFLVLTLHGSISRQNWLQKGRFAHLLSGLSSRSRQNDFQEARFWAFSGLGSRSRQNEFQ